VLEPLAQARLTAVERLLEQGVDVVVESCDLAGQGGLRASRRLSEAERLATWAERPIFPASEAHLA
jgi:hypothetical protein